MQATVGLTHYLDQVIGPVVLMVLGGIGFYVKFKFNQYQDAAVKRVEALAKLEEAKALDIVRQNEQRDRIERSIESMLTLITKMAEQIATVEHEVKENSGLSLKDGVNHIRRELRVGMTVRRQALNVATFESIILKNGQTQAIAVSDAWTRLTGQSIEQVDNNGWLKAVAPHERQRVLTAAKESLTNLTDMDIEYTNINVVSQFACRVRHICHPVCDEETNAVIGWYGKLLVLTPPPHFHRRANDDPRAFDAPTLDAPTPPPLLPPSGES